MSRATYAAIPDADVQVDKYGKQDDVFRALRANIAANRVQLIAQDEPEAPTSGIGAWETLWSIPVRVVDPADEPLNSPEFFVVIDAKVSAGNADFRIQDNASITNGSAVNVTATSYGTLITLGLGILDAWRGSNRQINVQAYKYTSGTAYGKAEGSMASRYDY